MAVCVHMCGLSVRTSVCLYKYNPPETSVRCFALRCQRECVLYKRATETAEGAGRIPHLWRQEALPQSACMSADGAVLPLDTQCSIVPCNQLMAHPVLWQLHPIPAWTSVVTCKVIITQTVGSTCKSLTHHKPKRACCNGLVCTTFEWQRCMV